jgi:hypothetical protein
MSKLFAYPSKRDPERGSFGPKIPRALLRGPLASSGGPIRFSLPPHAYRRDQPPSSLRSVPLSRGRSRGPRHLEKHCLHGKQRSPDEQVRAIMGNARQEEFKHFALDLEFLTRRAPKWRIALQKTLFIEGDIVEGGERAEEAEGEAG